MNTSRKKIHSPLVSIIIPVFNQEFCLQKCLISVISQTYDNLEIIVVNDGSDDSSPALIQKFAHEDARVVSLDQSNAGVSAARNAGLDRATGQLVMFVDADDWLEPTCVAEAVEAWIAASYETENPLAVRFGHYRGTEEILPEETIMSARESFCHLLRDYDICASSIWALLIPRASIEEHHLRFKRELTRSEDVLFLAELHRCGCGVAGYRKALYNYRLGEGLGSRTYPDAVAKAGIFYQTLKSYPSSGSQLGVATDEALVHYAVRFYILSMIVEAAETGDRLGTVKHALTSAEFVEVMNAATRINDLPLWARLIAKSATRKHSRMVSLYVAALQKIFS